MDMQWISLIGIGVGGLIVGLLLGWLAAKLCDTRQRATLREEIIQLRVRLENEQQRHAEKLALLQQAREEIASTFAQLSQTALQKNSDQFLTLAREHLSQHQLSARHDLDARTKAIEELLSPVREALKKTEEQIQTIEKDRRESFGSLNQHLQQVSETQKLLFGETRNLVKALRRPEVRGQWGEITLKRLAELAGMVEHCDFTEQTSLRTVDGGLNRPDVLIHLPAGRHLVVDSKAPMDAYLDALESEDENHRQQCLERHAGNVRKKVRDLASKAYWAQLKNTPDFVILFIPGEQFLTAALERDRDLFEYAVSQRVMIATPTSYVALLRTVAYGWQQAALTEHAERIRDSGEKLYTQIATFSEHLERLGRALSSSVDHYNSAIGSLESRVLKSVREFEQLGVNSPKQVKELDSIENNIRSLNKGA